MSAISTRTQVFIVLLASSLPLLFGSCSTSQSAEGDRGGEQTEATQTEPSGPPELPEHADSGPLLSPDRSPLERVEREGGPMTVEAVARGDDALYLKAVYSGPEEEIPLQNPLEFNEGDIRGLTVDGEVHALAGLRVAAGKPVAYLRVPGNEMPSSLELRIVRREEGSDGAARFVARTWPIEVPEGPTEDEQVIRETRLALADWLDNLGSEAFSPVADFYYYAAGRFRREARQNGGRQTNLDMWLEMAMSNLTGRQAIEETLQADQQLRADGEKGEPTTPVTKLEPVSLPEHPWEQLLDEADDEVATESVADLVPSDRIYARFDSLEGFIGMLNRAGETLTPMLGSLASGRHFDGVVDRYEAQLGIDASLFAERFGDLAVDEVALLLDDPYLPSGTAVTIVFRTDTPKLVNAFLDKQLSDARDEFDTVDTSTRTVSGHKIDSVSSHGRHLSHVRTTIDGAVVVSNSSVPIEAILEVEEGGRQSLADDPGFRFMRHWYPVDRQRTGFLYIGEDFVQRFTGPAYRVAQARRNRARADLSALHYRAMLHGWTEGAWPTDVESLFADEASAQTARSHADGSTIRFDLQEGAWSKWGRIEWLRPLSEIDVTEVTEREKRAYRDFRRRYERLGHRYIDPIAVSLDRDDGQTSFDVRVTPLHQRSDYRELAELVGEARLYEGPQTDGLEWSFGIGREARLRRFTEEAASRMMMGRQVTVDWLGEWGAIGTADRSGLWDGALLAELLPTRGDGHLRTSQMTEKKVRALDRLPIWLALEVRSPMGFAAFMGGVREFLNQLAPNYATWGTAEPYRDTEISSIEMTAGATSATITLYYTVTDGLFVLTLDRATLEHRIDALEAGYTPRPAPSLRKRDDQERETSAEPDTGRTERSEMSDESQADADPTPAGPQASFVLRPDADKSWLIATLHGMVERSQMLRLPGLAAGHRAAAGSWPTLEGESLDERSRDWWGVGLRNHHGRLGRIGDHSGVIDPLYGLLPIVRSDFRGDWVFQKLPSPPVNPSPITDWISGLERVDVEMSFEHHADTLGLHTRAVFEWEETK